MTKQEALGLYDFMKSQYGYLSDDKVVKAIWIQQMLEYQFEGMLQGLKNWINRGEKYAPTTGQLIQSYKIKLSAEQEYILELMDDAGEFSDPSGDADIREWNRRNRMTRARQWISGESVMPDWFREKMSQYGIRLPQSRPQIGGVVQ